MNTNNDIHQVSDDLYKSHITILQDIIKRFSTNSANAKNLCLTLVSALLVFSKTASDLNVLYVAIPIIGLMAWMDAYYLGMERQAVHLSRLATTKFNTNSFTKKDLYSYPFEGRGMTGIMHGIRSLNSLSILPFYLLLLTAVLVLNHFFSLPAAVH